MNTIISYLDNMFRNLPKTQEMEKLKEEILANMEDKYHELLSDGKKENEAIGIVISEFGNIDELIEEFEVEQQHVGDEKSLPFMSEEEVNDYLRMNKRSAKMIGLGVMLCILAPALLIITNQFIFGFDESFGGVAGLVPLFLFIAVAVVLFIYAGMEMEKYKYIEYGVEIPREIRSMLQQKNEDYHPTFVKFLIVGVVLILLAPLTLIVISTLLGADAGSIGVFVLLSMVALAVYIFVYFGMVRDGYRKLLRIGEYSKKEKEENRVIDAASSIIWPLAVVIFLISGFIYEAWAINWLIFPITALLSAMFYGAYKLLKTNGR
ncbi:permease prefix domain 1-containing protein [Aquibacillus koreensis]|uniref:Permease prefix domain 1-containing protein n=1 Tax=Aquibacillus koreensis TaxID=279446 RepID=A0A9X4AIQ4_9BACI|nr:permease prefix domain 1-containing protein [Aquibacillus koreensis]MCT2534816.1 permease prefix domain 1-containing protein [Aquibacillus koreensis]MDC3419573.1 permease prefix domain 1-containing protein [Aquibacillus koreensis]